MVKRGRAIFLKHVTVLANSTFLTKCWTLDGSAVYITLCGSKPLSPHTLLAAVAVPNALLTPVSRNFIPRQSYIKRSRVRSTALSFLNTCRVYVYNCSRGGNCSGDTRQSYASLTQVLTVRSLTLSRSNLIKQYLCPRSRRARHGTHSRTPRGRRRQDCVRQGRSAMVDASGSPVLRLEPLHRKSLPHAPHTANSWQPLHHGRESHRWQEVHHRYEMKKVERARLKAAWGCAARASCSPG